MIIGQKTLITGQFYNDIERTADDLMLERR